MTLRQASLQPYESGFDRLFNEVELEPDGGESLQTWAITETLNILFDDEKGFFDSIPGSLETIYFERCLAALNRVTQASRLVIGETLSRQLSRNGLDANVMMFDDPITETGEEIFRHADVFPLHQQLINPTIAIADDPDFTTSHQRIGEAVGFILKADDAAEPFPLVVPLSLAKEAQNQIDRGEASPAIITLTTAAEGLLRGVHRLIRVDLGDDAATVRGHDDMPFTTLVRRELPKLLAGNWQSEPEAFMRDLYDVRNRITHAGRAPLWVQIQPAFTAYFDLEKFLEHRIDSNWKKYPRTFAAWNNPSTTVGMKILSRGQMLEVNSLLSEAEPFWLPYDLARR